MDEKHYSFSQLQTYSVCPLAYYLERIATDDFGNPLELINNAFAQQGSLIHDLIDKWAKKEIPSDKLCSEYERRYPLEVTLSFPKYLTSKGYAEKTYQQGLDYFTWFDEFSDYEIIDTEHQFQTYIDGHLFVGIIDMLLKGKTEKEKDKIIILDHKSKSLATFKKEENDMYRQQYLYSKYIKESTGNYPDILMFNLFKENGLKKSKPFDINEYEKTLAWASKIINDIETNSIFDWMNCESKVNDFYCSNICSVRNNCFKRN